MHVLSPIHHWWTPPPYYNEAILTKATCQNFNKYAILQPLLSQQGWEVVPPIIIATDIEGTTHTPSVKQLHKLHIPTHKTHTWKNDHKLQCNTIPHTYHPQQKKTNKETKTGPTGRVVIQSTTFITKLEVCRTNTNPRSTCESRHKATPATPIAMWP